MLLLVLETVYLIMCLFVFIVGICINIIHKQSLKEYIKSMSIIDYICYICLLAVIILVFYFIILTI